MQTAVIRHCACIVRRWLYQRRRVPFSVERWWKLNGQMKAQCVRCGYVYPHITFDLPEQPESD